MITVGRVLRRAAGAVAAQALLAGLLVGLPWGLWHYIGWPLPEHLPSLAELETLLSSPLSTPVLLDLLACAVWPCWARFVLDVARCVPDAARGMRMPALGPVHALAAALVSAAVLGLFGPRTPNTGSALGTLRIAPAGLLVAQHAEGPVPGQVLGPLDGATARATPPRPNADQPTLPIEPAEVFVRAPHHGVHDSLWRIADRELDDGARWPDIFALNQGHPQPDGGTFTNPNLIFPGERMILPPDHAHSAPQPPPAPPSGNGPHRAPTPTLPTPTSAPAASPAPAPTTRPGEASPGNPGAEWEPAVFVGAGLAAAISAALLLARRRHRRSYRPGSARRDDLPVAPVVYQLRLAHLRESHPGTEPGAEPTDTEVETEGDDPGPITDPAASPRLGVRDGREIALNLATARGLGLGLGLAGPGALPAARALLLTLLAPAPSARSTTPARVRVMVPEADLTRLLGAHPTRGRPPSGLDVVADLDTALNELEALLLHRAREHPADGAWPPVVLVARPPAHDTRRLQAVLDNGASLGLLAVLLGQWRPGISAYVRAEGTVSATSPGPGQALVGARLFRLPEAEAADLLALLHHAHSAADDNRPPSCSPAPTAESPSRDSGETRATELEVTEIPSAPDPTVDSRSRADPAPAATIAGEHPHDDAGSTPSDHPHPLPPITLTVLGAPRVMWTPDPGSAARGTSAQPDDLTQDITATFPPRQRELLVFLALHPDGVSRDVLVTTLWEHSPPDRPTNALNTALSRLRQAIHTATGGAVTDIVAATDGRFRLDPRQVDVDYWHFTDAVTARRAAAGEEERIVAYRRIVAGYRGALAEGMDTEWIDPAREATRRDALDAVAALARTLVDADPQRTLDLLETARAFDPHNELLYRDIMRLQHRLGRLDAIARTLSLLATRLAEIDEQPTPQTVELATRLQHPYRTPATTGATRTLRE